MPHYAPLWNTILTSSLWSEDKEPRLLFISMLAAKDENGIVWATVPGLSRLANLTLEETTKAIAVLEAPDPNSSSPEFEGRRVAKVDGGWQVLNHHKYRDKISELREYNAKKQREYRKRRMERKIKPGKPLPGELANKKMFEAGIIDESGTPIPPKDSLD